MNVGEWTTRLAHRKPEAACIKYNDLELNQRQFNAFSYRRPARLGYAQFIPGQPAGDPAVFRPGPGPETDRGKPGQPHVRHPGHVPFHEPGT